MCAVKVLLLTQVMPFPPDSGPKAKTWNLVKWLGARHDLTLASFSRDETARELDALRGYCRAVHTVPMVRGALRDAWFLAASLWAGRPWTIARDARAAMHRLVARLARETDFDVVHIDQLNMAQYAAPLRTFTVLDAHNALWLLYRRLARTMPPGPRRLLLEREWRRLRVYEGAAGRRADAVLAVSAADRAALAEVVGADREITVVPISIDPDELPPLRRRPDANRVVSIGTMFWPPNSEGVRWFIDVVWPRIRTRRPDVELDILGARPPRALRELASPRSGIAVHGYVADPTPYLERAGLMVVPLLAASGVRVKILTALAQGLPVVTTTVGCEGIAVESGTHLLVADEPDAFADAVLRVLADPLEAERLSVEGRRLVVQHYDYRHVHAPLQEIYARARHRDATRMRPHTADSGGNDTRQSRRA